MAEERAQRRLAAILAADVVGYSRLMQADEAGTLPRSRRGAGKSSNPLVARHRGRIVKVMGDGVLVEFASAVDAVDARSTCRRPWPRPTPGCRRIRRIVLRIGINLGDVMVEGSDLYGDGVNIAARLEALGRSRQHLRFRTVFNHVRSKVKLGFDDLGEQQLKNIAEPVRVYRAAAGRRSWRCRSRPCRFPTSRRSPSCPSRT